MSEDRSGSAGTPAGPWRPIFSHLAHDVRDVAGAVDLWIEALRRAPGEAELERAVRGLRGAVTKAVRLADDLSDTGSLLDGTGDGLKMPFDLGGAVDGCRRRLEGEAAARDVRLELEIPAGFAHAITGDEIGWGRALDRIVGAALLQVARGGRLTMRLGPAATGGAEFTVDSGALRLPADDLPLLAAWGRPRASGESFPLGLWLARAFLVRTGGRLELREGAAGRSLVAFMP